ncbi:MAG: phosphoribosylglycinamide formyltransferase [Verrucomicrobiota bacterium]
MDSPFLSSWSDVAALREQLGREGRKLVFTNGCFDLLHAGHVRYLQEARDLGDALVIALNTDDSVRALKGPSRPVHALVDRAEVLRALRSVDRVVAFSGERCTEAIQAIQPQVYAKGGDYTLDSLHPEERSALEAGGSEIHLLSLVPGKSTTATLQKLKSPAAKKFRLGVLGSGNGSNLRAIFAALSKRRLVGVEVALVISDQKEARILSRAEDQNVPAVFVDPGPYQTKLGQPAQKEIVDRLKAAEVDLVVLAGFMRLVKEPLLSAFPNQIINIHPSLLPKYKGLAAWKQALDAGESETGCTVHYVDEGMDTGRILAQAKVPIQEGDTPKTLHARIQKVEHVLYPRVIGELAAKSSS